MPRRLHVALHPLLNRLDVLLRILELLTLLLAVAAHDACLGLLVRVRHWHAPAAVLDARRDVARQRVSVGVLEIEVIRTRLGVVVEKGVHGLHLACVGVHASRRLAGLDVAPDHGHHVALVVHEAGVEVGHRVRVGRGDVRPAAREGVLEKVEHGEEVSGGPGRVSAVTISIDSRPDSHQHVVAEPAGNDTIVHHGLVRFVLKVRIPAALEVRSRPGLELLQFCLGWADLDAGVDAVGRQGAGSLDVPLLEDACFG